ncbi:enoyl-CoA hydratase/isomerase family protein [Galbibacter mesophilus]|uniref:enoyl-CoA hydratase/isomerase family protein n=1 Tax=Galbibacter mesophilus TaxID=379069 RepID=UPI00191D5FB8|nr:enoyl-CoA hydratase/isomerase family protein [Galbibacter mesophilus]MCM5664344.1 enoyl-CoA hydratase/isomerase family protein [Galbibacter mesophilus]
MIQTDLNDGVFTIVLNNPSKMNCIGFEMLYALQAALNTAEEDENIQVVVLRGAGEKAFSSGANTKEFGALTGKDVEKWIRLGNDIFNQLENLSKPTVAFLNGYVMGGGFEMALACDFRLANTSVVISNPEVGNGWLPGWGGMARLLRLVGEAHAKQIVLLSEKLDSTEAFRMGLITEVFETENAEKELLNFTAKLKNIQPKIYSVAKRTLMDSGRTTYGSDVDFDVLAVQLAQNK